jgi:ion channel-forming bestrophin family protein
MSPGRAANFKPVPLRAPTHASLNLDDYFTGPRDIRHHSKWPYFARLHGSILPKLILPLIFIGAWATAITCISHFVYRLGINPVLLTVLGFVVGLALSFRSSTAYERYGEGTKYWANLILSSRNLARIIWIHCDERHSESPELGKQDLLAKLTALNLINAFAVSLKHRLRFEPGVTYPDLEPLIGGLTTMAGLADQSKLQPDHKVHPLKHTGEYLGVSFAESNPRKIIKKSKENLGNIPLEILTYLQSFVDMTILNGTLNNGITHSNVMSNLQMMSDSLAGSERVLNHPVPIAYSISIAQITWVYVMLLPFQLYTALQWITIPGTMFAAYIIFGIAQIGHEIENPFGHDVNDLPLDTYCRELAADIDVLTSLPKATAEDFVERSENKVLYPLSLSTYNQWADRSVSEIRDALRAKAVSADVKLERVLRVHETNQALQQEQSQQKQDAVEEQDFARKQSQSGTESTATTSGVETKKEGEVERKPALDV